MLPTSWHSNRSRRRYGFHNIPYRNIPRQNVYYMTSRFLPILVLIVICSQLYISLSIVASPSISKNSLSVMTYKLEKNSKKLEERLNKTLSMIFMNMNIKPAIAHVHDKSLVKVGQADSDAKVGQDVNQNSKDTDINVVVELNHDNMHGELPPGEKLPPAQNKLSDHQLREKNKTVFDVFRKNIQQDQERYFSQKAKEGR